MSCNIEMNILTQSVEELPEREGTKKRKSRNRYKIFKLREKREIQVERMRVGGRRRNLVGE